MELIESNGHHRSGVAAETTPNRAAKADRLQVVPELERPVRLQPLPRGATLTLLEFVLDTEATIQRVVNALRPKDPRALPAPDVWVNDHPASGIAEAIELYRAARKRVDAAMRTLLGHAEVLESVTARVAQIAHDALRQIYDAVAALNRTLAVHQSRSPSVPANEDVLFENLRNTLRNVEAIADAAAEQQWMLAVEVERLLPKAGENPEPQGDGRDSLSRQLDDILGPLFVEPTPSVPGEQPR